MKHVFEHPPEEQTGKRYWRSLGELSDTPEFRGWLEQEFPAGAAQMEGDEVSRRSFLKLMGASMALAGLGSEQLPPTRSAPGAILEERGMGDPGQGALLRDRDAAPHRCIAAGGRQRSTAGPIKIEGNPLHPASGGATDAFAQASILDLYDPARSKRYVEQVEEREEVHHRSRRRDQAGAVPDTFGPKKIVAETREREAFEKYLGGGAVTPRSGRRRRARVSGRGNDLAHARTLARASSRRCYPKMRWAQYEPLLSEAQNFGTQISFGDNSRLVPRFDRADVVLSLGGDFLDCGEGDVASISRLYFAAPGVGVEGHR